MASNPDIYRNLPGNTAVTQVVDAWHEIFSNIIHYLVVEINRPNNNSNEAVYYDFLDAAPNPTFIQGSKKAGVPLLRPRWNWQFQTRWNPTPAGTYLYRRGWIPAFGESPPGDLFLTVMRRQVFSAAIYFPIAPPLRVSELPIRRT